MNKEEISQLIDTKLKEFKNQNNNFRRFEPLDGVTDQFSPITGASQMIGFYGTPKISKLTITGSKGGNAALESVCSVLAAIGLFTDSTS